MLSYMLPTGNKPPAGEQSQNYNRTRNTTRNDHQVTKDSRRNVIDTTPNSRIMTTTTRASLTTGATSPTNENEIGENRYRTSDMLESPKHQNGVNASMNATTRKSTLHASSRVTKDDSLHSIDSEASTVGSDRKGKIINGAKHASLKRVSFGSSKGSMVETLVYETPVQEEPENNHFMDDNGRLPAPMIPVPDTEFRKEGATPMLKWMDKRTGKASMNKATIVKISEDVEELQRVSIGITGSMSDSTEKIFGTDVMHKRKELQEARRKSKSGGSNEDWKNSPGRIAENEEEGVEKMVVEEDEEASNEDTESKQQQQRFLNAMKELASQVTEENIRFLESLVDVMKASSRAQGERKPGETKLKTPYEVPDFYTTPGRGKVPIWEGMNFYLYDAVKASIETKSHVTDKSSGERLRHWPLLVRLALVEIYGKKLADHSAKGSKSGSRPAIDHRLFRAIHYWASDWVGHEVDMDAYVEHINKTCYNKRKGTPQDIKKRVKKPNFDPPSIANPLPIETVQLPDYSLPSSSGLEIIKNEPAAPVESASNETPRTSQFPNSLWDSTDCNLSNLSEGREKVRVAFLGPTPSPATPGVLLLEPLLPNSGHLMDGMSTSPAELLTTHTEHTSPAYHAQISTDSGWDNPFRPDGDLSREADEIVELIKGGKPITPTPGQNAPALPGCETTGKINDNDNLDSSTRPLLNATSTNRSNDASRLNQGNGNAHGTSGKGGNVNSSNKQQQPVNEKVGQSTNTATVQVGRVTAQGPGDASQVEHVTLKKKPKCKCCVLQ